MDSFLSQHTRQPKLYIDLPSGGKFYNDSVIKDSQFVQIPVYAMTAMDEINIKTPDALFSGIATANVIRSCIPTILDPNKLVRYDIEYILLAIKIASEGDKHNIESTCPKCGHENGLQVDLNQLLAQYENMPVDHYFSIGTLNYHLTPINYSLVTKYGLETYRLQRQIFQLQTSEDLEEEDKQNQLSACIQQLATLNNIATINYIASIADSENEENNLENIKNFILNNEATVANKIIEEVKNFVKKWQFPPLPVTCQNNECKHEYQTSITIDYSNFFGKLLSISRNLN